MEHDEFIGLLQERARLDSRGAAETVARATLETLGERLAGGEPKDLASQLPDGIGRALGARGGGERFGPSEFYGRVAERASPGTDAPAAAFQARAVMSVVREAVSGGELDDVVDQLPDEFAELFDWQEATTS